MPRVEGAGSGLVEEGRKAEQVEEAPGAGGQALVRRRAYCPGSALLLAGYAGGKDSPSGPQGEMGLFGANGGSRPSMDGLASTDGLAMAGHPWILPFLACIKATSLVQLN